MRGKDFDDFLDGACGPLIAGSVRIEADSLWHGYVYTHNGIYPRCVGVKSNSRYVAEQERADIVLQLMRRGANVHVCETRKELQQAAQRLWPANVLEWIKHDVAKSAERNRAKVK